ncbi:MULTISPECIES: SDR family oxidoreductase [unclassified Rothia (in: high G+C Gram-positive bacteria)]|uniref:SDR family NAD(P)-dependent oxidoreductase n=1 Tax=unclassified Rothia (in: high G+C Gram-positive bacteria) TaxID=2689056 RepID=UPI00195EA27F|nr:MULTISPECIES: SDR family oxidoreductase [unclassified Rothia (in: high G+C Gram-positive bacteria)]MBM7051481.1 SDR family oxidoreductase [Rothia sp. ZJ1223]QRZ61269.1 SDR family oxidoreductase [Rothia sp. ZJ932]
MTLSSEPFVLITGASAGIGREFARQYAQRGYHLVIHGRNRSALESLAQQLTHRYGVEVEILTADLAVPHEVEQVTERLSDAAKPVEILINNAGFGLGKAFENASVHEHAQQVEVLAKVPLQLMHVACQQMLTRGRGRVINVASVAAFMPNGTYSAVKRFLVTLSESAHLQYAPRGISVTAVCPGLTRTGFHGAMGVDEPMLPGIFWLTPEQIVREAIDANLKGKAVCVPSLPYKVLVAVQKIMPAALATELVARTRNY